MEGEDTTGEGRVLGGGTGCGWSEKWFRDRRECGRWRVGWMDEVGRGLKRVMRRTVGGVRSWVEGVGGRGLWEEVVGGGMRLWKKGGKSWVAKEGRE